MCDTSCPSDQGHLVIVGMFYGGPALFVIGVIGTVVELIVLRRRRDRSGSSPS